MAPESELDRRLSELSAIHESLRALTATLDLPEVLRTVLARIKTVTRAEALSLMLYDAERDELVFVAAETLRERGLVGLTVPPASGIATWAAHHASSVVVPDVTRDARFNAEFDRISGFTTRSVVASPLRHDGRVVGVIELANPYGGGVFHEADRLRLDAVTAALGPRVVCDAIAHNPSALQAMFAEIATAVPSEAASLLVHDAAGHALVFTASRTLLPGGIDGVRLRLDQGIAGWVARHRVALRLDDASTDPRHFSGIAQETGFVPHGMLCVPVVCHDRLLGVVEVMNKLDGSPFTDQELGLVQTLADHAGIAIEHARLYREAEVASITDDLTGLGNTRRFNRLLPELLATGAPLSLIVLDLDNFKAVVDTHGHLVGSRTLAYVGHLIAGAIRPGDHAARFGGDEFVVILPHTDPADGVVVAERIRAAIADARILPSDGVDISAVTASVGVASYPEDAMTSEALFKRADAAMYAAKRHGKNAVAGA